MAALSFETIHDDKLTQLYFTPIDSSNELVISHWHNHLEVLYILEGTLCVFVNEQTYELHSGDILIINPKDIHNTRMKGRVRYYLLQVSESHLARISKNWSKLRFAEHITPEHSLHEKLSLTLEKLASLNQEHTDGYQLLFLIQIYQFLYDLYINASTLISDADKTQNDRDFSRIEKAIRYANENYMHPISLSEIAKQLSLSPEYFSRLFKKYTDQSYLAFVNQIRLSHFHDDLLETNESISYLLEKNGVASYKTFMKHFKDIYGMSPHKYRESNSVFPLSSDE